MKKRTLSGLLLKMAEKVRTGLDILPMDLVSAADDCSERSLRLPLSGYSYYIEKHLRIHVNSLTSEGLVAGELRGRFGPSLNSAT